MNVPAARMAQSRKLPRSHSLQISGAALARSKFNVRASVDQRPPGSLRYYTTELDQFAWQNECPSTGSYPPTYRWEQWEDLAMKTTILAYVIALGGVAMIAFG